MNNFHQTWYEIIDWTGYMARKYGGTATDVEGKTWDWGQAICRVLYGSDWNYSKEFERECNVGPDMPAPEKAMSLISAWDTGEWPEEIINPDATS